MAAPRAFAGAGASSNGTSTPSRARPTVEIVPESTFIVFNGSEHEAETITLRGVVRLSTPASMSILRPRLRLEGKRKISWLFMTATGASEVADKRVFYSQEQRLGGVETAHKINAGSIEWPFEFDLVPETPESVEGLRGTSVIYTLQASVSRPGWNARDLTAQTHIRLVRSLGPQALGVSRSRSNADIWANKVSYSISIPTDTFIFGTSITTDIELSPIRKGLRMGKIELKLQEIIVKRIQASESSDLRGDRKRTDEMDVAKNEMDFPDDAAVLYSDDTEDNPTLADEMYKFQAKLQLPKSLAICRQDVDTHAINITHRLKVTINIHNPEGHVSQLVCRLPVKLFISPRLPIDDSNRVSQPAPDFDEHNPITADAVHAAPPMYGEHQLDQMFSSLDMNGLLSHANSGSATPADGEALSRRGSDEGPASLAVLSQTVLSSSYPASSPEMHGAAVPSILHSRLTALQNRHGSYPGPSSAPSAHSPLAAGPNDLNGSDHYSAAVGSGSNHASSPSHSSPASAPMSRSGSTDFIPAPVRQLSIFDVNNLSRVPSYGAAVRTPGTVTPYNEGPPSYIDATSRPPSAGASRTPSTTSLRAAT